jgi:hypothetical protein
VRHGCGWPFAMALPSARPKCIRTNSLAVESTGSLHTLGYAFRARGSGVAVTLVSGPWGASSRSSAPRSAGRSGLGGSRHGPSRCSIDLLGGDLGRGSRRLVAILCAVSLPIYPPFRLILSRTTEEVERIFRDHRHCPCRCRIAIGCIG